MDKDEIIKELTEKNSKLEEELQSTKEHLKKYTAPVSRKYKENTNYKPTPEQKKEYNKQSYLNRKYKSEKTKL